MIAMPPIVGVPALRSCGCAIGPSSRICWPMLRARRIRIRSGVPSTLTTNAIDDRDEDGDHERDLSRRLQRARRRRARARPARLAFTSTASPGRDELAERSRPPRHGPRRRAPRRREPRRGARQLLGAGPDGDEHRRHPRPRPARRLARAPPPRSTRARASRPAPRCAGRAPGAGRTSRARPRIELGLALYGVVQHEDAARARSPSSMRQAAVAARPSAATTASSGTPRCSATAAACAAFAAW